MRRIGSILLSLVAAVAFVWLLGKVAREIGREFAAGVLEAIEKNPPALRVVWPETITVNHNGTPK